MDFITWRIKQLLALQNGNKNFYIALLLSIKFMMMIATVATYLAILTLSDIDNSWSNGVMPYMELYWLGAVVSLVIFAGKEIVIFHMKIFDWIDEKFRKAMDQYSLRYWKKHKKDPPVMNWISKYQGKVFGKFLKMPAKKRRAMLISMTICYIFYMGLMRYQDELAMSIDSIL
tara:strand:- start:15374 stop:15892 length:519 start_codon:yes stop_codon:yes gene_type:complete